LPAAGAIEADNTPVRRFGPACERPVFRALLRVQRGNSVLG